MKAWNQTTNLSSKYTEQKIKKSGSEIHFGFHGAYALH
jgi:hypothetical protein